MRWILGILAVIIITVYILASSGADINTILGLFILISLFIYMVYALFVG